MQLKSKAIVVLARCNLVSHFRTHLLARVAELGGWVGGLVGGVHFSPRQLTRHNFQHHRCEAMTAPSRVQTKFISYAIAGNKFFLPPAVSPPCAN